MTGQALLTLESQRQKVLGFFCAESHQSAFSSIAIRRKYYRPRLSGTGIRIKSDVHSLEDDLSAQRESDTDSDTDDVIYTNFTQWTDKYKLSTYCTCSPQVYRGSEWVTTNRATPHQYSSPLSILTARQGRQAPSMSQLKRLDTSHNRHWLMQCKRIHCRMFHQKQTRMKFKC